MGLLAGGLGVAGQPISARGCVEQVRASMYLYFNLYSYSPLHSVFFDRYATAGSVADLRGSRPGSTNSH